MDTFALLTAAFAAFALTAYLASVLNAAWRLRIPLQATPPALEEEPPPVTIIRPVCGLDAFEEETLRSTFALHYPSFEVLFCCANRSDPVVPLVERLMDEHPQIAARLLLGDERISLNPKLNNIAKGWRAAAHEWIVMADSNVDMPPDFIERLLAAWRKDDTGLVSAPPIGCRPGTVWAELECAFLNAYQARWQYAADSAGMGFAQGKVMLWRRSDLEKAGGIQALGAELAEDAAATKVVRGIGKRVRLADGAFPQPLGIRSALQVWNRQLRWARLRRCTFPQYFALEPLSGLLLPLLAGTFAIEALEVDGACLAAALMVAIWLASEAWLNAAMGWHLTWRSPFLWLLREIALPVIWLQAWFSSNLSWRGSDLSLESGDVGLGAAGGRP
jgi:ceramide glucosyltransferase